MGIFGEGGPEGNQWGVKLPTPELRKMAFESYCAHISKGKSKRSWTLKSPRLSWETMEKYIKQYSTEFDPDLMKIAKAEGFYRWEQVIEDSAEGKNRKANTQSLAMIARNKMDWDKGQTHSENVNESFVQAHANLINQLANQQKAAQEEAN